MNKIRNCFKGEPPKAAFKMARIIEGAKLYDSPLGLVPGQVVRVRDSFLVILPGPPREVKALLREILNDLTQKLGIKHRCKKTIYLDILEAEIAGLLLDVMKKFNVYAKAILTKKSDKGLPVEILSYGENRDICLKRISAAADYINKHVSSRK